MRGRYLPVINPDIYIQSPADSQDFQITDFGI